MLRADCIDSLVSYSRVGALYKKKILWLSNPYFPLTFKRYFLPNFYITLLLVLSSISFSSQTIRWRAREKRNKGCFGFDQLYGIEWRGHYTRVLEWFLHFLRSSFLQWMLMQTYLMTIYLPALHKWNQFDHHHPTRVDNGFEHGVIYSKILVFKQVTCHSLLRGQSNLTKQVHVSKRHRREQKLFCERRRGEGSAQLTAQSHSYRAHA